MRTEQPEDIVGSSQQTEATAGQDIPLRNRHSQKAPHCVSPPKTAMPTQPTPLPLEDRQQRMQQIQEMLNSGTYRVPAEKMAPLLMEAISSKKRSAAPSRKVLSAKPDKKSAATERK